MLAQVDPVLHLSPVATAQAAWRAIRPGRHVMDYLRFVRDPQTALE
jgi:hypothetical protein